MNSTWSGEFCKPPGYQNISRKSKSFNWDAISLKFLCSPFTKSYSVCAYDVSNSPMVGSLNIKTCTRVQVIAQTAIVIIQLSVYLQRWSTITACPCREDRHRLEQRTLDLVLNAHSNVWLNYLIKKITNATLAISLVIERSRLENRKRGWWNSCVDSLPILLIVLTSNYH